MEGHLQVGFPLLLWWFVAGGNSTDCSCYGSFRTGSWVETKNAVEILSIAGKPVETWPVETAASSQGHCRLPCPSPLLLRS